MIGWSIRRQVPTLCAHGSLRCHNGVNWDETLAQGAQRALPADW